MENAKKGADFQKDVDILIAEFSRDLVVLENAWNTQ
jgi:hypothetical protein